MATLTLYQPINMNTLQAWDGEFPIVQENHIQAADGVRIQDYFGSFQFSNDELTGGTLTSTKAYQNGLYYEVTGLNIDATTIAEYVYNFDMKGAMREVLKGDDTLIGSSGDDVFIGGSGNDHYDGGTGIDTVHYTTNKSSTKVSSNGNGYTVQTPDKTDTLVNIERIDFGDGSTLALDVGAGEHTGQAYRLYQAAFDRQADTGGLKYWVGRLDNDLSLTQAAQLFVESPEFKKVNSDQSNTGLITSYYQHVLNRAPDAGGLAYWENAMATGNTNAAYMLASFSESAENIANTAAILDNGIWLS